MKKITTVADFIKERVASEHKAVVAALRKLMKECAPDAREVITYGILAWKQDRILAVISPTKKDITLAFSRGAEFADKYGLLRGVGKVSKHVKLKSVADINRTVLRYYIKQAVTLAKN